MDFRHLLIKGQGGTFFYFFFQNNSVGSAFMSDQGQGNLFLIFNLFQNGVGIYILIQKCMDFQLIDTL